MNNTILDDATVKLQCVETMETVNNYLVSGDRVHYVNDGHQEVVDFSVLFMLR